MCYGISGTIDDKMRVRSEFKSSHDTKANKPDENRRVYWEWEVHFPDLFKPVFTNIKELEEDNKVKTSKEQLAEMRKKVKSWLDAHKEDIRDAFTGKDMSLLLGKAKTKNINLDSAKTRDINLDSTKTGDINLNSAETGDICLYSAKAGYIDLGSARTKEIYIKNLETSDKDTNKLIAEFSKKRNWSDCTLTEFVKWLQERKVNHDQQNRET